jgi:histidine ammonia-lyase
MQEDHVSMAWGAARKLRRAVDNLGRVLAVELTAAARALDLRAPLSPSPATGGVRDALRAVVPGPGPDRWLAPELDRAAELIRDATAVEVAERSLGGPLR